MRMPYVGNIEKLTEENTNFRHVLFTSKNQQMVVMTLQPNEDIGEEVHPAVDQFLRIESGQGKVIMHGEETVIAAGSAIIVPAGTKHNVINTSQTQPMKLYTVYSPPNHPDGKIHTTKAEALADTTDHA